MLTKLSENHKLTISCMCSDHSKFTSGGSISNHHFGRGVDIAAIDGVPVNASNFDAREMASHLTELDPTIRPDEIGSPFAIAGPAFFTDAAHQNHIHIGFDDPVSPDFKPLPVSARLVRGMTRTSPTTFMVALVDVRSDVWLLEGFRRPQSLWDRLASAVSFGRR